jgi:hypothetical protein
MSLLFVCINASIFSYVMCGEQCSITLDNGGSCKKKGLGRFQICGTRTGGDVEDVQLFLMKTGERFKLEDDGGFYHWIYLFMPDQFMAIVRDLHRRYVLESSLVQCSNVLRLGLTVNNVNASATGGGHCLDVKTFVLTFVSAGCAI